MVSDGGVDGEGQERERAYGKDDVFLGCDLLFTHRLGELAQVVMDLPNYNLGFFAGKNHIQEAGGSFLGESTVFSAFHVKAFDFELVDIFAVDFKHVDSGIFLFGVE